MDSAKGQTETAPIARLNKANILFVRESQDYQTRGLGGYTEYKCLGEKGMVATKPSNMTYEKAAVVSIGGLEALHNTKKIQGVINEEG